MLEQEKPALFKDLLCPFVFCSSEQEDWLNSSYPTTTPVCSVIKEEYVLISRKEIIQENLLEK